MGILLALGRTVLWARITASLLVLLGMVNVGAGVAHLASDPAPAAWVTLIQGLVVGAWGGWGFSRLPTLKNMESFVEKQKTLID
ncbi:hypothetical protein [Naasia aerilata]|uniref:DoxX family protein n=1 Tax=Naasia aerilata TaxID=1162966 RepID=A0ABN6XN36_9MICO|nr:hypothetical protein [Naasia aerilata]BDZ46363.1 hypothetical protein GCM10025866_22720 [Naasia aerilata]